MKIITKNGTSIPLPELTPRRVGVAALLVFVGVLITNRGVEAQHEKAAAYETAIMDAAAATAKNKGAPVDMSHFHGVRTEYTDPAVAQEETITYSDWLDRDPSVKLRAAGKCLLLTANGESWSEGMTTAYSAAVTAEDTSQPAPAVEAAYQKAGDLCGAAPSMIAITQATPKMLIVIDGFAAE